MAEEQKKEHSHHAHPHTHSHPHHEGHSHHAEEPLVAVSAPAEPQIEPKTESAPAPLQAAIATPTPMPLPAMIAPSVSAAPAQRNPSALYTPAAILIAGIFIGGGLFFGLSHNNGGGTAAAGTPAAAAPAVNINDVKTAGEPYIGDPNAPVVMAFWSDYQCPYCKAFEVGGIPQIPTPAAFPDLVKNYVDTGKLKVVFKDFQFLGQNSIDDGEYARAVWALYPQQFFAWREAMYNQQPEENSLTETANKAHVEKVTASIAGVSVSAVEANIVENKKAYDAAMQADESEGESFGIQGTPGFIVGTTLISGAEPLSAFTAAIDPLLK